MSLDAASPTTHATVFASAGSGKTWLLVSRLVRLLLAGARPEGTLAVTFTRKAAGEMQARLRQRLRALATAAPDTLRDMLRGMGVDSPSADDMARARGLFEQLLFSPQGVRTTTFHALCQDLLRRFPLEADIPPGFELLEATGEVRAQAWEALFLEATLTPDSELAKSLQTLFDQCGSLETTQQALDGFLDHRGDWWAYTEAAGDARSRAEAKIAEFLDVDPRTPPLAGLDDPELRAAFSEYAELMQRHPTQAHVQQATAVNRALQASDPEETLACLQQAVFTDKGDPRVRKASKAQAAKMGETGEARFLDLHETLVDRLTDILDHRARVRGYALNRAWYHAGGRYLEHYQRIKAELRVLDFTDLEWRAYALLNHTEQALWIQYKLDARIDHLLVDEFQDTNPTQWRLLLPLLEELAAGDPERDRSVFLVGDVKQSIYGFRRAKPELQAQAAHWIHQRLGGRPFHLDKSWRSAPPVIEFVNRVFSATPLAARLTEFQSHDTHQQRLWGAVEVLRPVESESPEPPPPRETLRNPLREPRLSNTADPHLEEGHLIAGKISELVRSATPVEVDGRIRPLQYGDIILLLRSRTHAAAYERALREAGIPFLGAERGTLLESLEIRDMVALIETLMTPYNDLALAQVLRSPLFEASDEDLIQLARSPGAEWFARLGDLTAGDLAGPRLRYAHDCLTRWRTLAGRLPIHDLLDHIYAEADVIPRYSLAARPDRRAATVANLTRFLELALEIDSGRYPSLVRFLATLKGLRTGGDEAPDTPAASGAESRLRMMTIHAAKGLEAPVVFLADAAARGNDRSAYSALVDWPAEAPAPELMMLIGRRRDLDRKSLQRLETAADAEAREQANLLYVALTRARQYLFVSATLTSRSGEDHWYASIHRGLEGWGETTDDGWRYVQGTPPVSIPASPGAEPPVPHPEGLDRRLSIEPGFAEIAPSRQIGTGGGIASEDEDARTRGIAIHRLLDLLSRSRDETDARRRVAAELALPPDNPELTDWVREALEVIAEPRLQEIFDTDRHIHAYNEIPVLYPRGKRRVFGIIDRLVITTDRVLVVDYKSHPGVDASTIPRLVEHYRPQLRLYADGARALWPDRNVQTALLFTATRQLELVPT